MPDTTQIPPPPKQSLYGWPLPDRREEFAKLLRAPAKETSRVEHFKGETVSLPIIRIPLNLPKYRIANGRTASAQQEWVTSRNIQADFFDGGDPELEDVQIAQHQILKAMIKEEGLLAKFQDASNKQVEPILLDEGGFVVNGNRRLCCWRELHASDPLAYAQFGHVDAVILPHCDERELDRLEARLQIEKDIRSDYSWDAEANMVLQKQRLHGFTTPELAQLYGKTKREIEDLIAMRELAAEYLRSRGKEHAWSEVRGDNYAFQELLKARLATSSPADSEIVKEASFALIDAPGEAGGRLYAVIPKVREHLAAVKKSLAEAFPQGVSTPDATAVAAFGGATAKPDGAIGSELALVAAMKKDAAAVKRSREVIVEVIRSQDEQIKERDTADFLFNTLKRANALMQNAAGHGLRAESSIGGVASQIESIKLALARVEKWLSDKKA